jgi:hypothetical protein
MSYRITSDTAGIDWFIPPFMVICPSVREGLEFPEPDARSPMNPGTVAICPDITPHSGVTLGLGAPRGLLVGLALPADRGFQAKEPRVTLSEGRLDPRAEIRRERYGVICSRLQSARRRSAPHV